MKRKRISVVLITLILAAGIFTAIYTRPITIDELWPDLEISQIHGEYMVYPDSDPVYFVIDNSEKSFKQLMTQFQDQKFRKSLISLLPQGARIHPNHDGDYRWEVLFQCETVELPDGNAVSGNILRFENYFGNLEIYFMGETWRCTTMDQEHWLDEVLKIIVE